jgi:glycosyltransferase involved in cell wall biosynthesis
MMVELDEAREAVLRKWNYLLLVGAFALVYSAAWLYSRLFARRKPVERVRRIAAFWWCPSGIPGSDLRLGRWKAYFERDGFQFDNFPLYSVAEMLDAERGRWSQRYALYRRLLLRRFRQFLSLQRYDVAWIERGFVVFPLKRAFMERCVKRLVGRVVVDCSDGSDYQKNPGLILDTIAQADTLTVACSKLLELYQPLHPSVVWFNWAIPTDPYMPKVDYGLQQPPVVGWMGSPANARYLKRVAPALAAACRRVEFRLRVICREPVTLAMPAGSVEYHAFDKSTYYHLLAGMDVGVCPILDDGLGSVAKVAMKHQEFMLCAIPQVCSPVGISEATVDNDNALIARDLDEWTEALVRLLTDESLRRRLGKASRQAFLGMYTYEGEYPKVRDALTTPGLARRSAHAMAAADPIDA